MAVGADMITVFERIPEVFVNAYDAQFKAWSRQFREIGPIVGFRLKKPIEALPFEKRQGRIIGVRLKADIDASVPDKPRMVIQPQTLEDEEAIKRHCFDLKALVLN